MPTRLIGAMALAAALVACDHHPLTPDPSEVEALEEPDYFLGAARRRAVHLPFRARAVTTPESLAPDERCGDPPRFLNTQVGEGRALFLGRFTVRFEFCVDATDLLDDGMLTEGESIPYDDGIGVIVAANGDELHLTTEGAVLPSDHPDYDFEFQDRLVFDGGTGRFEGARGVAISESYVVQDPERTDHIWRGRLILERDRSKKPKLPRRPRR